MPILEALSALIEKNYNKVPAPPANTLFEILIFDHTPHLYHSNICLHLNYNIPEYIFNDSLVPEIPFMNFMQNCYILKLFGIFFG